MGRTSILRLVALPVYRNAAAGRPRTHFAYFVVSEPVVQKVARKDGGGMLIRGKTVAQHLSDLRKEGHETYHEWQEADPSSWRKKSVTAFDKGVSMVDPHEILAAHIAGPISTMHTKGGRIEMIYPAGVESPQSIRRDVHAALVHLRVNTTRNMVFYTATTPLTAIAAILPGPNIFFAANALRLWSLWRCRLAVNVLLDTPGLLSGAGRDSGGGASSGSGSESEVEGLNFTFVPSENEHLNWPCRNTEPGTPPPEAGVWISDDQIVRTVKAMGIKPHEKGSWGEADVVKFVRNYRSFFRRLEQLDPADIDDCEPGR